MKKFLLSLLALSLLSLTTITNANSATNPNSLAIDFKELYDSEDGLAITPEMGYVRLNGSDGNEYINLSNGDIVEFFVRPTETYLENHNSEDLFFIDRPVFSWVIAIVIMLVNFNCCMHSRCCGSPNEQRNIYFGSFHLFGYMNHLV